MPWEIESVFDGDNELIYTFDSDNNENRFLVYKIFADSDLIEFYPKDYFIVEVVTLEGFSRIPDEFSKRGYIKAGVQYYLGTRFSRFNIKKLSISKSKSSSICKSGDGHNLVFAYDNLKWLKQRLTDISNSSKREKSFLVDEFCHNIFPKKFEKREVTARQRASKVIENLDSSIVKYLGPTEIAKFLDFIEILLSTRYSNDAKKRELSNSTKLKVDDVALSQVIEKFKVLLEKDPPESEWGLFLGKNLFLVESKYINIIPEINVVLASSRRVDFGLIDSHDYLDIFEIKKPSTPLLARRTDRGNYYWSTDAVKAIAQAEKYLFNAERKASTLTEDINRERGIQVRIVKPRAVVIIGQSLQLDTELKEQDFRVLRNSLKNIEIVLFDELLYRLENQKNKIYIE